MNYAPPARRVREIRDRAPEGNHSSQHVKQNRSSGKAAVIPRHDDRAHPRFLDVMHGDADTVRDTPYGKVGTIYSDRAIEMVWVSKQGEAIDPGWVCQDSVDLLVVLQGRLKVEFETAASPGRVMMPGEVLVLPPRTRCRAYGWPRNATRATIFLAVYPQEGTPPAHGR